jgi:hypothetical protein
MTGIVAVMAGLSVQTAPTLVTFDFSTGSGSVTIPAAPISAVVEVWGGGGGGGFGIEGVGDNGGGGGGAGGYSKTTLALSGADAAKTILYTVGARGTGSNTPDPGNTGGTSTVSSGTYTITPMIALGGGGGTSDANTIQGQGGTASGGSDTNTTGTGGGFLTRAGAAATAGVNGLQGGAGGDGGLPTIGGETGDPGLPGRVRFVFTI